MSYCNTPSTKRTWALAAVASSGLFWHGHAAAVDMDAAGLKPCTATCATLAARLPGKVAYPGQTPYTQSLKSYFAGQEGDLQPACIVRPSATADVAAAVQILAAADAVAPGSCKFAVRGGGHSTFASSANIPGGVTIDLSGLDQITVSADKTTTSVGPGVRWGAVYQKLDALNLSVLGARGNTIGTAGLLTGGGLAFYSEQYGFACDNVVNFEVVLASGAVVSANARDNTALRNALRGGSNNFGIVTRFDLFTFPQAELWGGDIVYDWSAKDANIDEFVRLGNDPKYDEAGSLYQVYGFTQGTFLVLNTFTYSRPAAANNTTPAMFQPFKQIQPQYYDQTRLAKLSSFTDVPAHVAAQGLRNYFTTTTYANDASFLKWVTDTARTNMETVTSVPGLVYTLLHHQVPPIMLERSKARGGNSLGLDSSKGSFIIAQLSLTWDNAADDAAIYKATAALIAAIEAEGKKRGTFRPFKYLNYANKGQAVIENYGAASKKNLLAVSKKYDPKGLFQRAVPGGFKLN